MCHRLRAAVLFALVAIALQSTRTFAQRYNGGRRCTGRDCIKIGECPWAQAEIRSGRNPEICGFVRREAMVCCPRSGGNTRPPSNTNRPPNNTNRPSNNTNRPPNNTQSPSNNKPRPPANTPRPPNGTPRPPNNSPSTSAGTKSDAMCKKWSDFVVVFEDSPLSDLPWNDPGAKIKIDQCAKIEETLILGGESAKPKEFPHMGSVGYMNDPIRWRCGCSLISEKFVLSAGHCSDGKSLGPAKWVRLGELDTSTEMDEARPVVIAIRRIINHPQYNTNFKYNDIALYELEKTVTFNAYVRPACLHTKKEIGHKSAIATGWGHLELAGKFSPDLRKVKLNIVTDSSCRSQYTGFGGLPQGLNSETMVCAGEEGKDTCQGDSGGPLQLSINEPYCSYSIIGVTSFGKGCGELHPGVYSRVSAFVPWIESIVWP